MQSENDTLPIGDLKYSGHDKNDEDALTVLYLSAEQDVQTGVSADVSPEKTRVVLALTFNLKTSR